MGKKLQVGVIGLGKFGLDFGKSMVRLGQNVVGIDKDPQRVKQAQNELSQTYLADVIDQNVLTQLGFADLSHVLISVGNSITSSVMIAMYLMDMGLKEIWVKAVNEDHKKLLHKMSIDNAIIPESMAANQLASRLAVPGFIDYLPFDQEVILKEIKVDKLAGQTLRQINLTSLYDVQVIAVKKNGQTNFQYVPKADSILEKDDILVLIGNVNMVAKIKP